MADQAELMDRIYRLQRYFYDATRKVLLPGRDALLDRMVVSSGAAVLEVGSGTARNLLILARRFPNAQFYGLDVSTEMLTTAEKKVRRSGLINIHIARADAENFDRRNVFNNDQPFDAIFFSYSLSMIPDWRRALEVALANLAPEGTLYVVDFWDQQGWPGWVRRMLVRWLALFHVRYESAMIDTLKTLAGGAEWTLELHSILRRYAFLAQLSRKRVMAE
jgi:S-adenosylmethionine-diacylgycerolhomoserine-N-methlytransferase